MCDDVISVTIGFLLFGGQANKTCPPFLVEKIRIKNVTIGDKKTN